MGNYRKIIAVDFDGTLFEDNYPNVGAPIWETINRAKEEQANGACLILWTCRYGEELERAVQACKEVGLEFEAVNENAPFLRDKWGEDTRKIGAAEYWDDRAVNPGLWRDAAVRRLAQESIYSLETCKRVYKLLWENEDLTRKVLQTATQFGETPAELLMELAKSIQGEHK